MEKTEMLRGALERMLLCEMPDDMRSRIQGLIAKKDASEYELQSAYMANARRLVLAKPRAEIDWNPTVDGDKCVGCGVCYDFCPHNVYDFVDGRAVVARPTECVILCSNCMPKCAAGAITFPQKKNYVDLLKYE